MKTMETITILFVLICLFTLVIYNGTVQLKTSQYYETRNKLCADLTDELMKTIQDNSTCKDYYCYFVTLSSPESLENKTTPLCACDCRMDNDTIMTFQVLSSN